MAALVALARVYDVFPGDEWALLELRQWRAGWLDTAAILHRRIVPGQPRAGGLSLHWRWR